jgi:hypothetical protein
MGNAASGEQIEEVPLHTTEPMELSKQWHFKARLIDVSTGNLIQPSGLSIEQFMTKFRIDVKHTIQRGMDSMEEHKRMEAVLLSIRLSSDERNYDLHFESTSSTTIQSYWNKLFTLFASSHRVNVINGGEPCQCFILFRSFLPATTVSSHHYSHTRTVNKTQAAKRTTLKKRRL